MRSLERLRTTLTLGNLTALLLTPLAALPAEEPVVVHLFDWSKEAQPFRLTLDNARFFPGRRLECGLLTPVQQSAAEHARAETSKDFSKFTRAVDLRCAGDERQTVLEIPALNPWAMLLVSPAKQENP